MSNKDKIIYGLFVVILIGIVFLFTRNQKIVDTNSELQEKLQALDNTVFSLRKDITEIRQEKEATKKNVVNTKEKIKLNENKKISIINKPYTDTESIRILTEYFKKNNIPLTYSN